MHNIILIVFLNFNKILLFNVFFAHIQGDYTHLWLQVI